MNQELVWGFPDIVYLFLGGLGAGALFASACLLLRGGGEGRYFAAARYGAFVAPVAVGLGLMVLSLLELTHPFRGINLYKTINFASPMSVGSWLLLIFMVVSLVYAFTFLSREASADDGFRGLRKVLALGGVVLGFAVAIYPGFMHAAMPSVPFWHTPLLPLLFLVSALTTGIAFVMLARRLLHRGGEDSEAESRYNESGYPLVTWVTILIAAQLVLLFVFLTFAQLTIRDVKEAVSVIMAGGSLATEFWLWVVTIGLLVPVVLGLWSIMPRLAYGRDYVASRGIEVILPVTVLVGAFMLRYVIVVAGQITGPIGL